ncbi:hypothetical protein I862_07160 [endosymbiont of Acanthamoeba sp. UWC8]|uniref:hypothetical protein n=1 Tax=endosymbiont of Acanthamoeba sp. UWC8 TaxID=86106 RepID=UPI0004D162C5|nr:hypothetical protein [endosymbiont of Acanthamoeba sp. UWC8]AIF81986.1 hypothetical protein I862_07160 [endosymbiont of Acanthamoeba sp. UWC8]
MRLLLILPFILVIITASGCAKVTKERHSPDFESKIKEYNDVVVLPPKVEVNMVDVVGKKKRMHDYEDHLENIIKEEVVKAVQDKGFRVKKLHRREIWEQQLSEDFGRLQQSFNAAKNKLYARVLWEEEKAFSITENLGLPAILFGGKTNSNLLLFVDYEGAIKTNGARARDFVISILANSSAAVEDADASFLLVAIVDATNGNILWSNIIYTAKSLYVSAINNFSSRDNVEAEKLRFLLSDILKQIRNNKN